jgi:protein-tyrosine kinase
MSLIERAISRVRQDGSKSARVISKKEGGTPLARSSSESLLRVTDAMKDALGFNVPAEYLTQSLAEYRHIKRQLLADMQDRESGRSVLVASALAGEGKSQTAANLARSIALEPDFTVLLVDADVINPRITRSMGLAANLGLTDALSDPSIDVELLVVPTDIPGFSVLPAGGVMDRATEFFGSGRMRHLLQALESIPNRIVLIDSLPLLQTTEARALASLIFQIVLVVRAEFTPISAVRRALDLIGKGANVKMVLNDVARTRLSQRLGYGYDYDYSHRQ